MSNDKQAFELKTLELLLEANRLLAESLGQAQRWRDAVTALLAEHGIEAPEYDAFAEAGNGTIGGRFGAEPPPADISPTINLEQAAQIVEGLNAAGVVW